MGKRIPLVVRIQRRVEVDANGCWIWTGCLDKGSGYGRIQVDHKTGYSHRVAYELLVGQIPDGLELDHLCRVRACCNPDHLEPVTTLVNQHRSPITNATRICCPKGHPYGGENLRYWIDKEGNRRRVCRTCNIARSTAWQKARKAAP